MPMKKNKLEQIVTMLRRVEVELENGKTTCKPARKPSSPHRLTSAGGRIWSD